MEGLNIFYQAGEKLVFSLKLRWAVPLAADSTEDFPKDVPTYCSHGKELWGISRGLAGAEGTA